MAIVKSLFIYIYLYITFYLFRGYEDMSANMQIESKGKEHKYHYDGSWNRNKINFDSNLKFIQGWSNFEWTTNLATPFDVSVPACNVAKIYPLNKYYLLHY